MKATLIKTFFDGWTNYHLKNTDGVTIGTTKYPFSPEQELMAEGKGVVLNKLSIKNCEEITAEITIGYDLDELANNHVDALYADGNINWDRYRIHFKKGFQKALSIFVDKKFSERDMMDFSNYVWKENTNGRMESMEKHLHNWRNPTEWDVEIELVCPHPLDTYICGMQYGCDGDGCNHPNQIPYLDKDKCLILRRY